MHAEADLFAPPDTAEVLAEGAVLLRGLARDCEALLVAEIRAIAEAAPFRRMTVPGGGTMSVAMTGCGSVCWIADTRGYRYAEHDPLTGRRWPALPAPLLELAARAAVCGGFAGFAPDSCLINRYEAGARMGLHQDRDERDFSQPIVSVSLGLPAVFLWGGARRRDPLRRLALESGDVVVWGGAARLAFHGVAPLREGTYGLTGGCRFNLTFRRAAPPGASRHPPQSGEGKNLPLPCGEGGAERRVGPMARDSRGV